MCIKKWLHKKSPEPTRDTPGGTLGALSREIGDVQEWREEAQALLVAHERRLRRLQGEIRTTRLMLDVFLVLLLAGAAMWYFWGPR